MHRLAPCVVAAALLLSVVPSPAVGQVSPAIAPKLEQSSQVLDSDAVVKPPEEVPPASPPEGDASPPEGDAQPPEGDAQPPEGDAQPPEGDTEPSPEGEPPPAKRLDADENTTNTQIKKPGYGSAANQRPEDKRDEIANVAKLCETEGSPPTSTMLGLPGSIGGDDKGALGWHLIVGAVAVLLIAGLAFELKRRGRDAHSAMGPLSTASTLIGVVAGITGLAVQFIPGVAISQPPPPEATMEVGQVHPRITRGEYAKRTHSTVPLKQVDRREVGNVIWVEIELRGYQDKTPFLQYALYDPSAAGALLPGTKKHVELTPKGRDVEALFVPIWVGYPRSESFEAQFRLLDDGQVQQMASTGKMEGSKYRYTCPGPTQA
jgi:hypothetical protein